MATAAGITLTPRPASDPTLTGEITTTDANLSLITVAANIWGVRVEVRASAGDGDGEIQYLDGTQGGTPASTGNTIVYAGGSVTVTAANVGKSWTGPWSFAVARNGAAEATFIFSATVA